MALHGILLLLVCALMSWLFILNPVRRDRWMYARSGWGVLWFSLGLIVLVLLLLWHIAEVRNIRPEHIIAGKPDLNGVGEGFHTLWNLICQFADPGSVSQSSGSGNWIALVSAFAGVVCLSGLLVSSLVSMISHRTRKWKQGLITYNTLFSDYVVIIGLNEQAASIVRQSLNRNGVKYVLIQTRQNVEDARMALELKMDDRLEDRIVFYAGERTSAEDIGKLRLEKAVEVYILGESVDAEGEKDHDSFNVNCLEHISEYIKEYKERKERRAGKSWNKRIRVHVNFEYQSTFTAFKATHVYQKLDRDIEFVPFNVHEIWAKKILVDNFAVIPAGKNGELKVQRYRPIDSYTDNDGARHAGISKDCDKTVHLVVLGMNQMGTALATQAALLCHFPNHNGKERRRTTITFIDDHAKVEADYYIGRFSTMFQLARHRIVMLNEAPKPGAPERVGYDLDMPFYDPMAQKDENGVGLYDYLLGADDNPVESFLDVEWEFIQGNVASVEIQDYIKRLVKDQNKTATIAICFNNSQQAIASAMYLPEDIYKEANQVLVYQQNCFDMVDDIANGDMEWKRYPNLYPFGMIEGSYSENQFDNHMAKLVNQEYMGGFKLEDNLLNVIDKAWDQLGIVQKLSNLNFVDSIPFKYRSKGINNIHNYRYLGVDWRDMVDSEHLRWTTERLMSGFRCLTKSEQESCMEQFAKMGRDHKKKVLANKLRAHLDICSTSRLQDVDPKVVKDDNDFRLMSRMPDIIKAADWVSVLRLSSRRYAKSRHVKCLENVLTNYGKDMRWRFHFIRREADGVNRSFWMSEVPVTERMWDDIMGVRKMYKLRLMELFRHGLLPVVNVSKQEVDDFLDILRKKTGLNFLLPSKNEWLHAAKLTKDSNEAYAAYVTSPDSPKKGRIRVDRWAGKQKSGTGLRHILGNVWEWTRDEDEYHRFEFCGGSWMFTSLEVDLNEDYWHNSWEKDMKSGDLGFRLIWNYDGDRVGVSPDGLGLDSPQRRHENSLLSSWFKDRMVLVKAGKFVMGANEVQDPSADKNERPRHIVEISEDYYMCNIPVTQQLWNLVMGINHNQNPSTNRYSDNLPQTDVSWYKVQEFIRSLNEMKAAGTLQLPTGAEDLVFRLPTEAEWEYAAKDGHLESERCCQAPMVKPKAMDVDGKETERDHMVHHFEYSLYAGSNDADEVAWFGDSVIRGVALKQPNALGLYDMSGNVWEWCHDFYLWDMYDKGNKRDPLALDENYSAHVFRGGSWRSTQWDCRCTRANFWISSHTSNDLGFRLVLGKPIGSVEYNIDL